MALQDKTLTCKDCDSDFVFSASEQEFYAEKGFQNEPQRCPSCRKVRKQRTTSNSSSGGQRQMFSATCSSCGVQTQVPFKPNGTKPVYCRDCFQR
ncbi:MAG: zinc-binding protein [Peptococcaceae bacterium BICA1-8]|nr:MAG: zinc-binding protein [Peptococcaceae bacterium BICA1-8]